MATRFIDVTFDNGETYTYEGVPFDTTPEQAQERIAKDFPDLIVSSIDGSRRSEAVDTTAKAPRTTAPKGVADVLEQASSVTDAVVPGSGEFVKGAQGTYGNLHPDEEATYGRDSLRIEPMRIPEEIEAQILQQVAANKGNTSFNQEALNKIYSDFGYQATPASEEFLEAVRKGGQTGGIDYSKMDQELVSAEEKKQREARDAFAKTREGMDGEFARAIDEGAQDNFMWSGLSRGLRDLFDVGKEELRAKYPGQSEEWYEEEMDKELIRQTRGARDYYRDRNEDIGTVTRFTGNVFGNLDPTIAIGGPGKTVLGRMLGMGAVETGLEGIGQTGEIIAGVRNNYDPTNIAAAGVGGALFQGAAEGIGKIIRTRKSGQEIEAEVEAQAGPLDGTPYEAPKQTPEPMMSRGVEGEEAFPGVMGLEGQAAIEGPRFTPKEAPVETPPVREEPVSTAADDILNTVTRETEDWTNRPEITVHNDFSKAAEDVDPTALGYMDVETGSVNLNAVRIEEEALARGISVDEMSKAVVFHESLGHYGLSQRFLDDVDDELLRWDSLSPAFRKKVDDWVAKNPEAYADDFNPRARAAEEVFAEMSERGVVPSKLMDKIFHYVKEALRDFGWKTRITEKELGVILDLTHQKVTQGSRVTPEGSGIRYSTSDLYSRKISEIEKLLERGGRPSSEGPSMLKTLQGRERPLRERSVPLKKIKEAVDYLEEVEAQGKDVTDLLDRMLELERKVSAKKVAANNLAPETPKEAAARRLAYAGKQMSEAQDRLNTLFSEDERSLAKKNTKAYKEWQKEFDELEQEVARKTRIWDTLYNESKSSNIRYMKSSGESEGPLQGYKNREDGVTPEKRPALGNVRSTRKIDDILEETAPERSSETFNEWIDEAGRIKMSGKAAQALKAGTKPPELLAAEDFAVRSANRIHDLSRKIADGHGTSRDEFLLTKELERLENVQQSIADVVANAARLINVGKITASSDKALKDNIRMMQMSIDPNNPQSIKDAAEKLVTGVKDSKERARKVAQMEKILDASVNTLSIPRSIMSSMDLSAPLRQGIALIGRKEFYTSIPKMFKQATSEKAFQKSLKEIHSRPTWKMMEKSKLAISDMSSNLTAREEQFISDYAQRIPIMGAFIRASERGYAGFLNNLRADTFDTLIKNARSAGVDLKDSKTVSDISDFINSATGRGDLGRLNKAGPILNTVLFSPRLIASRVNMLNPVYYAKLSPFARKQAIKEMMKFGTIALTALSIAKMGGMAVEADPRSSDFGKVRNGNTRYDILGGFGQYVTLGARLVTNEKKNARGEITPLKGDANKRPTADSRRDVAENFFRNKFAPIPSYISDFLEGSNAIGEPFDAKKSAVDRMLPLFVQDLQDMTDKYGNIKGSLMTIPTFFGVGVQDYAVTGTDRFGHVFDQEDSTKNAVLEKTVKDLEESTGETALGWPSRTITVNGEKRKLTDDEWKDYVAGSSKWIEEDLKEETQTEEWQQATSQERIEILRKIARSARKDAREELFSSKEEVEVAEEVAPNGASLELLEDDED